MTNIEKFSGTFTAMTTPFEGKDRRLALRLLEQQLGRQITGGVRGIVPVGTTGESATLDHEGHQVVIEHTVETVKRLNRKLKSGVLVVAGTGSNATKEAIMLTVSATKAGADAALLVAPYYNKPSQRGLIAHFGAIADAVPKLPLILYSIPGRCGIEIGLETVRTLAENYPNIIGIKEAGGSVERMSDLVRMFRDQDFVILSGDDSMTLPFMALGAHGVISVASNAIPRRVVHLVNQMQSGNIWGARKLHYELLPFIRLLFLEGNPVGIKCAMKLLGRDTGLVRLPLVEASPLLEKQIASALTDLGFSL